MNNLKKLRLGKKLRQKDIAKQLGITQQAYANYERSHRQPDFETLKKLSKIFNVTTDMLIGNSDEKISHQYKITQRIENTLINTDLTDKEGKLNDKGIEVILELIQNNKELLKARLKEL